MTELLNKLPGNWVASPWFWPVLIVFAVLLIFAAWRVLRRGGGRFEQVLREISFDRIEGLVIPGADEGEIMVDRLILTSQGLLVLEVKDVQGTVFGGDKLKEWTVISDDRRYTFSNPQPALYDRVAAVRQVVREVPVEGRILFLDGAEFTKGTPQLVVDLEQLAAEFGEADKAAAKFKIEAFKPHWDLIRRAALSAQVGELLSRNDA